MSAEGHHPGSIKRQRRITILPTTGLGRWALGLAAALFPFVLAASVVPRGAVLGLACGMAGGVAALTAIVRDGERAVAVFAALVPLAIAAGFLLAEVVFGHA